MPDGFAPAPAPNATAPPHPPEQPGANAAQQLEALLRQHPELRDDEEMKKLLQAIEEADDA